MELEKTRILFDLKAALDGYSGIPQETRLLFRSLRKLGNPFEVDGLLQHEHETLSSDASDGSLPPHERIERASRTVVSFYSTPVGGRLHSYLRKLVKFRKLLGLRWQAATGKPIALGRFEAEDFQDFVWTRLFDKTLNVQDMSAVTSARYRIAAPPRGMFHLTGLAGLTPLHRPRYLTINADDYDFVVTQTPFPARVYGGGRLVVRYHDAVPMLMPHTIGAKRFHQASHYHALKMNVADGAIFACNSTATRNDLLRIFPELGDRAVVIHNMISDQFAPSENPRQMANMIIANRASANLPTTGGQAQGVLDYLLVVSTLEPRKNHAMLISAWEKVRLGAFPNLALVLVGAQGWDIEEIESAMRPWVARGQLFHLSNVPAHELKVLYRHAALTVCPSRGEGFDYSGIEAMCSGGTVAASDIAVHREIYDGGAAYFDPYDAEHAAATIARLLSAAGADERLALKQVADAVTARYRADVILTKWRALFETSR